jgi:hypothetical protein
VLATQEFVANGGGRPSDRRRRTAASPGGRAAVSVSVGVAVGVPDEKSRAARSGRSRLLLSADRRHKQQPRPWGCRLSLVPRSASVDASSQGSRNAWLRSSAAVRGPDDAIVVR